MQIESWLVEATQKRPDLVVLSNKLAAIWIRRGRFDEAKVMYERLIGSNPDNAEALNNLAWLLALRGQDGSQDPLKLIDRAIDIQGKIPSLLDTRAVVLICANKLDEAIETLNDAQNLDKRNISVPLHMSLALHAKGKTDEARDSYRKAVDLGWKPDKSDPLERSLIDKLRHDLGL